MTDFSPTALAARLDRADWRVYAILGDGECQEGQIWEAAMAAAHYRLGNLTAILDWNGLQIDGPTERVISLDPLAAKWEAFGWQVRRVDGHNFPEILEALDRKAAPADKPLMDVRVNIFVERPSQKAIIIGRGGSRLREVGTTAREGIEKLLGQRVYLDLHVKVAKDWQRDPKQLGKLGFNF